MSLAVYWRQRSLQRFSLFHQQLSEVYSGGSGGCLPQHGLGSMVRSPWRPDLDTEFLIAEPRAPTPLAPHLRSRLFMRRIWKDPVGFSQRTSWTGSVATQVTGSTLTLQVTGSTLFRLVLNCDRTARGSRAANLLSGLREPKSRLPVSVHHPQMSYLRCRSCYNNHKHNLLRPDEVLISPSSSSIPSPLIFILLHLSFSPVLSFPESLPLKTAFADRCVQRKASDNPGLPLICHPDRLDIGSSARVDKDDARNENKKTREATAWKGRFCNIGLTAFAVIRNDLFICTPAAPLPTLQA